MAACTLVEAVALVDAHQIGLGETGNETWARNLVRVLEADGRPPLHYAVSAEGAGEVPVDAARLHIVAGSSARRLAWDLPRLLRRLSTDVVVTQYTLPLTRSAGVVVIHDLSFERPEAKAWIPPRTLLRYRVTIGGSARRARVVVVPTEHTRTQIIERYGLDPERVLLAPLALDPGLSRPPARRARPGTHRTVLFVGTLLPRKNLSIVAQAVARLRARGDDVRLRLVGPLRPAGEPQLAAMRELLGPALEVVGTVSMEQLSVEYAEADVFAFPSVFEGFGLPLLEAMAAGTPIVSSNATCLPEVAGDAALLVDPHDEAAWVDAVDSLLRNEPLAERLRTAGLERAYEFTWERTGAVVRDAIVVASG